ncbi:hypothetical protein C0J52_07204, partial [Blattella germanica]
FRFHTTLFTVRRRFAVTLRKRTGSLLDLEHLDHMPLYGTMKKCQSTKESSLDTLKRKLRPHLRLPIHFSERASSSECLLFDKVSEMHSSGRGTFSSSRFSLHRTAHMPEARLSLSLKNVANRSRNGLLFFLYMDPAENEVASEDIKLRKFDFSKSEPEGEAAEITGLGNSPRFSSVALGFASASAATYKIGLFVETKSILPLNQGYANIMRWSILINLRGLYITQNLKRICSLNVLPDCPANEDGYIPMCKICSVLVVENKYGGLLETFAEMTPRFNMELAESGTPYFTVNYESSAHTEKAVYSSLSIMYSYDYTDLYRLSTLQEGWQTQGKDSALEDHPGYGGVWRGKVPKFGVPDLHCTCENFLAPKHQLTTEHLPAADKPTAKLTTPTNTGKQIYVLLQLVNFASRSVVEHLLRIR